MMQWKSTLVCSTHYLRRELWTNGALTAADSCDLGHGFWQCQPLPMCPTLIYLRPSKHKVWGKWKLAKTQTFLVYGCPCNVAIHLVKPVLAFAHIEGRRTNRGFFDLHHSPPTINTCSQHLLNPNNGNTFLQYKTTTNQGQFPVSKNSLRCTFSHPKHT